MRTLVIIVDRRVAPYYLDGFDNRFVFELALALDPVETTLERYHVDLATYEAYLRNPAFQAQLQRFRNDIFEKGLSFREKSRAMAEDMLKTAYNLIHDKDVPATVKADLIKWVAKVADLEPKANKNEEQQFLPALAAAVKQLSDGDLELQVTQIVARKQQSIDVTPTQH